MNYTELFRAILIVGLLSLRVSKSTVRNPSPEMFIVTKARRVA
jgi:hypothetical protein